MTRAKSGWEARLANLWRHLDAMPARQFVDAVDALAAELPEGDATALFERACARDSTGIEDEAEKLYRAALATGKLDDYRRTRATLQLASTLRILGQLDESERLITAELDRRVKAPGDYPLQDEARATLALTYLAQGKSQEAACLALRALAPHLTRYNRSVAGNAAQFAKSTALNPAY